MACNNCYPQPCNCNCPDPCPDPLVPCNGDGCIQSITSSCVTYDGNNVDCAGIAEGQTLNQVIEELGTTVCQLFDDVTSFSNFKCTDLSGCSIDALGDVNTTSATSGDVLVYNGTTWITKAEYEFTCSELNSCSIDNLGDVITTSAVSGNVLVFNGTNWISGSQSAFQCSDLNDCSIDSLGDVVVPLAASGDTLVFNGATWVNVPSFQFSCSSLSGCSLISIGNVSGDSQVSGNTIVYNGSKWIGVALPQSFSCDDLSGCSIDALANVVTTSVISGDVLINNGTNWINQPCASLFTASNGLTKSSLDVKLGGTLTQNTTIDANSFALSITKNQSTSINTSSWPLLVENYIITGGIETVKTAKTCNFAALKVNLTSDLTPLDPSTSVGNKHGVFSGTVYKNTTYDWKGILPVYFAEQEHASSGDTTWAVSYFSAPPTQFGGESAYTGTITNFAGLYISTTDNSNINTKITNKFAIYQEGINDISRFYGPVQNAGGSTEFTSDIRVKENIVNFTVGLAEIEQIITKKFNYTYNKDREVVGIIAQELETIIPSAVKQSNFKVPGIDGENFTDFRMVDQNVLFYGMLNAIKELSSKVKELEAKVNLV